MDPGFYEGGPGRCLGRDPAGGAAVVTTVCRQSEPKRGQAEATLRYRYSRSAATACTAPVEPLMDERSGPGIAPAERAGRGRRQR